MTTVAQRLVAIRRALDMTQAEMAQLAGISLLTYGRNERMHRNVSIGLLICLIERGFNANWLLTGIGEMRIGDAGEKPQDLTENVPGEVGASPKKPSRLSGFGPAILGFARRFGKTRQSPKAPSTEPHHDDLAVDKFAAAMKEKLARKRAEGRGGWNDPDQCTAQYLSTLLRKHVEKGDPIDVANFAMMLHQRGASISVTRNEGDQAR
jgi:transcriptional regulator with XRE-family HTH domain